MKFSLPFFLFVFLSFTSALAQPFDTDIVPADVRTESYIHLLSHKNVALVINQTSVIGDVSLLDILLKNGVGVKKIFVPEHGFRGNEDAGAKINNSVDSATGIPIVSLYGKHKKPTVSDLAGIDVVVYDLQDVGVRFYTYISTLEYCMEACAENKVKFVVLDRPDPNGFYVDGPVLEPDNRSFVGMQAIPVVYGMTCGEYARMLVGERWFAQAHALDLEVVKCTNYTHAKKYKLPVAPSPNLRTMAAVYAYPSLCLFEGTNISVGRGTSLPFQQYGCPGFEGIYPYDFTPVSTEGAKHPPFENKKCYGEVLALTAADMLARIENSFRLKWIIKAYTLHPEKDKFFNSFFVSLSGSSGLEQQIKDGNSEQSIRKTWQSGLNAFKAIRKKYLLYPDFE